LLTVGWPAKRGEREKRGDVMKKGGLQQEKMSSGSVLETLLQGREEEFPSLKPGGGGRFPQVISPERKRSRFSVEKKKRVQKPNNSLNWRKRK